jgi:CDP-diacylglycerol--glycerol-3-phosphate 3-phosphatidyltransferase
LARLNLNPNSLTLFGLFINVAAAVLCGYGYFFYAGFVLFFAGAFDILDGAVARLSRRVTKFGAFFDSVIDRYSDLVILLGIMIYYTNRHNTLYVALIGVAMIGSVLISYTRARAESLMVECKVGFLERPERIVLLIIGCLTEVPWVQDNYFLHKLPAVLWVLAVLSHWTVAHRMYHARQFLQEQEAEAEGPVLLPPTDISGHVAGQQWAYWSKKKRAVK